MDANSNGQNNSPTNSSGFPPTPSVPTPLPPPGVTTPSTQESPQQVSTEQQATAAPMAEVPAVPSFSDPTTGVNAPAINIPSAEPTTTPGASMSIDPSTQTPVSAPSDATSVSSGPPFPSMPQGDTVRAPIVTPVASPLAIDTTGIVAVPEGTPSPTVTPSVPDTTTPSVTSSEQAAVPADSPSALPTTGDASPVSIGTDPSPTPSPMDASVGSASSSNTLVTPAMPVADAGSSPQVDASSPAAQPEIFAPAVAVTPSLSGTPTAEQQATPADTLSSASQAPLATEPENSMSATIAVAPPSAASTTTPAAALDTSIHTHDGSGKKGMILAIITVALIAALGIGAYFMFMQSTPVPAPVRRQAVNTQQQITPTTLPVVNEQQTLTAKDTTDEQLTKDMETVDDTIQAFDTASASVDAGLSDKPASLN